MKTSKLSYEQRVKLGDMLLDPTGYKVIREQVGFIIIKIFFGGCFTGILFGAMAVFLLMRLVYN